jgi:hypothetical protein
MILKRGARLCVETEAMSPWLLLILPVVICGVLGTGIGYFYRYRVQLGRVMTVLAAIVIFVGLEITSGILSSKYTAGENLREQCSLLPPFLFLYLLPTAFGSSR